MKQSSSDSSLNGGHSVSKELNSLHIPCLKIQFLRDRKWHSILGDLNSLNSLAQAMSPTLLSTSLTLRPQSGQGFFSLAVSFASLVPTLTHRYNLLFIYRWVKTLDWSEGKCSLCEVSILFHSHFSPWQFFPLL